MDKNRLRTFASFAGGLVTTFLMMHGALNLFVRTPVRDTAIVYGICGAVTLVVAGIHAWQTRRKRARS